MINVLEYLEEAVEKTPHKIAFRDVTGSVSYKKIMEQAKSVGAGLTPYIEKNKPVAVLMEKSVGTMAAFFGIVYAGGCYSLLDPSHPEERLEQILGVLSPSVIIIGNEQRERAATLNFSGHILYIEDLLNTTSVESQISFVRSQCSGGDPLYINFTSGSTGVPKGVVVGHGSVIEFIDKFTQVCGIEQQDIIGNQAPFDFDVSVKDIYSTICLGATMVIIPKQYFAFPTKLLDYLCEQEVTTLIWAVSALCIVTTLKGFTYKVPSNIHKVIFSGEVMPIKHLNMWRETLPEARFFNVYGPTEITCNCTCYEVTREFAAGEALPIGRAFPGDKVFLLDENDQLIYTKELGRQGEICVGGACLALGYYRDPEQTTRVFVQNPLHREYRDLIYRTGDLACYLESGDLCFVSRKDFQIKHMGHRIELNEIELAMDKIEGVTRSCVIYYEEKQKIYAFYEGTAERKCIVHSLKKSLPVFMIPNTFRKVEQWSVTKNGKIDRAMLKELIVRSEDEKRNN